MANEKHLMLRLTGDYVPSTLPGEIWQCGLRLALVFGAVDPIGTLPSNWDPVAQTIARTESTFTINGNWSVNGPVTNDFDPGDYLNDIAEPAVAAWIAAARLSNQVRLRTIELMAIGAPDGNQVPAVPYAVGTPCVLEYTSSYPIGSHSTTQLPPQNSVAISHRTQQIGAAGRGRMFLPSGTVSLLSGAKIAGSEVTALLAAQVALLEGVAFDGVTSSATVRPIVTGGNFTSYAVINQVRVGNVMDSQRRRRNALAETYDSGSVTY